MTKRTPARAGGAFLQRFDQLAPAQVAALAFGQLPRLASGQQAPGGLRDLAGCKVREQGENLLARSGADGFQGLRTGEKAFGPGALGHHDFMAVEQQMDIGDAARR